jgi:hypothetical protein
MSSFIYHYHPNMPRGCPTNDAEPVGIIFKAIASLPLKASDFISDVESNKVAQDRAKCKQWGCSVWQDMRAVDHGREIYGHFRASYIVKGTLDPSDGQILTTPSKRQPNHSTFWKVHQRDVSGKFVVVLNPDHAPSDDPFTPSGT